MGLKIRLARAGAKKRPYYHIVVADSRSPRDGRFIEKLGSYNPMLPADHAERIRLHDERIAAGSGVTVQEVNRLLKQFDDMSAMMKRMNKLGQKGLMRGGLSALLPGAGGRRPF